MQPGVPRILIGLGMAAVGGIITLASYSSAGPGETYIVWWGLIGVGAWTAIQGISQFISYRR